MAKATTVFVCQQCGAESVKWMGKCPNCGEWNSLVEAPKELMIGPTRGESRLTAKPQKLNQIKSARQARVPTGIAELDRVLGGGIVAGSVVLFAGEPGIGKSTLMLQLAKAVKKTVLYVSGEESPEQIKIRAERLGFARADFFVLAETNTEKICAQIEQINPNLVIIDSVQTLWHASLTGAAGSVGQVRESTAQLLRLGKEKRIPIFLIGHVTKAGAIAGPKVLEHMVDTVIYFEGEKFSAARLLRATKNRFGATDEVGVFEMTDKGLKQVTNPSRLFLKDRQKQVPGSVVVATLEGTRPVLVEIQALVVPTQLPVPRRVAQGVGFRRLELVSAVLTKRLGLPLGGFDLYVNITGGLRIEEPAVDLGMALAIISSFKNISLGIKTVCWGELGLLGEIRPVSQTDKRAKEARRLGFTIIISPVNFSSINQAAKKVFHKG